MSTRMSAVKSRSMDVTSQPDRLHTLPAEPAPGKRSNIRILQLSRRLFFLRLLRLPVPSSGCRQLLIFGAVVAREVQQTNLVLYNVALRIVLEDGSPSRVLPLHVGYLLPVQSRVLLQHVLNIAPCAGREVGRGVCLADDASRVLAVVGKWFMTTQCVLQWCPIARTWFRTS